MQAIQRANAITGGGRDKRITASPAFNGDPDSTFGSGGNVIFSPGSEPGNGSPQYVTAMLLDANRPLAVGVNYTASSVDFLFLRLQNDRIFTDGF